MCKSIPPAGRPHVWAPFFRGRGAGREARGEGEISPVCGILPGSGRKKTPPPISQGAIRQQNMQKACHEESPAFCLRRIAAKRRKGYNSLFGTQRRKTPRTFRCPGCSVSQSAHTGITRIEVRPCICSTNRKLMSQQTIIFR